VLLLAWSLSCRRNRPVLGRVETEDEPKTRRFPWSRAHAAENTAVDAPLLAPLEEDAVPGELTPTRAAASNALPLLDAVPSGRRALCDKSHERPKQDMPDAIVFEKERRMPFFGFSTSFLHEWDLPVWTNGSGMECPRPSSVVSAGGDTYRYQWKVVVNADTDENGWQYARDFGASQWRHSFDTFWAWVRRRQHHGRRIGLVHRDPEPLPNSNDLLATLRDWSQTDPEKAGSERDAPQVEMVHTETDQFRRYTKLYLSIRGYVETWLYILETHKNLFSWKDETVTKVVFGIVSGIVAIAFFVPTRVIFSLLISFFFWLGFVMGQNKRRNRAVFLDSLSRWCNSKSIGESQVVFKSSDACTVLDDSGISRLDLQEWCKNTHRVPLDLKTVDQCVKMSELADLVVGSSPRFASAPRRFRAWHSDIYGSFMDHVPSDITDQEMGSICYKWAAHNE